MEPPFRFFHPIQIRYSDLDPQGHVNNARYFSYTELARVAYVQHLGLWDGRSWLDIGFILAEAQLTFKKPLLFGTSLKVGVRVDRLGNKSLTMLYTLVDEASGEEIASASTVLVTYDYKTQKTILIPQSWRDRITAFEAIY